MSLSNKIRLALLVLTVLTLILAALAHFGTKALQRSADETVSNLIPAIDAVLQADRDFYQSLVARQQAVARKMEGKDIAEQVQTLKDNIEQAVRRSQKASTLVELPKVKELVDSFTSDAGQWQQRALASLGTQQSLDKLESHDDFNHIRQFMDESTELIEHHIDALKAAADSGQSSAELIRLIPAIDGIIQADRDFYQALVAQQEAVVRTIEGKETKAALAMRDENIQQALTRSQTAAAAAKLPDVDALVKRFHEKVTQWVKGADTQLAGKISISEIDSTDDFEQIRELLNKSTELIENRVKASTQVAHDKANRNLVMLWGAAGIILIIFVIIGYYIPTYVTRTTSHLQQRIRDIARGDGDLTARLDVKNDDELGRLAMHFNELMGQLQQQMKSVAAVATEMKSHAQQVKGTGTETLSLVNEQVRSLEQLVTATEQITASIQEVAESAADSAKEARAASEDAEHGASLAGKSVQQTQALSSTMTDASNAVSLLEQEAQNIVTVLDVIGSIAEQTNLLALNAAIEAARAGDSGRGFAVVADEVRTLAGRTQESTQNIQQMITRLQSGVKGTVDAIESGLSEVEGTLAAVEEATQAFAQIQMRLATVSNKADQIAAATEQQSEVVSDINQNLSQLDAKAKQSAVHAQTSADEGKAVEHTAQQLSQVVGRFKL
ncbi:methyl-accepting chemotaxis protein [Gallaecimonas mangrovi]|uniref:methyl-accepting chemotaxis protein n=1 Tax=Gallaecimonas mangrovi TaxID=2291597 RepID=UPI000E2042E7|nr:methyl-accepting chemotaxis protein [Gallaecimonas mangrovi]